MVKEGKILIIGAGIAGLAAAQLLQSYGYTVMVVEARERIGGRIWTMHDGDHVAFDLGAQWIVGTQDNPVLELAQRWQVETLQTDWFSAVLYTASGLRLPETAQRDSAELLTRLLQGVRTLRDQARALGLPDSSLDAGVSRVIAAMNVLPIEQAELQYILSTDIEHELATDLSDLSLYCWDQEGRLEGDELLLPGGYDQIVLRLAEGLDIRRKSVVKHVAMHEESVVVTTDREVLSADRAIITVPLGTLQQGKIAFTPALPAHKQTAIHRLGVGVLNKVFLCFPFSFWPEEDILGHLSARRGEWSWFINLTRSTGKPVLLALNAGKFALHIESLSDREIVAAAMRVLRKLYGQSIPDPNAYYITRWASDPFSCGSYSHIPPGGSCDDYDILSQPIKNRLFFAGEATACAFAGTVHGAYLSGIREAERIMALG